MKWILFAVIIIVTAIGTIWVWGSLLPESHTAQRSLWIPAPPSQVYEVVSDFAKHPEWRNGVTAIEISEGSNGKVRYRETGEHGVITYEVTELSPPSLLVTRIADPELPFGGQWTIQVMEENGGSRVRIREDGEVRNAFFRFMARFIFGHHGSIESYLRSLAARFGVEARISDV